MAANSDMLSLYADSIMSDGVSEVMSNKSYPHQGMNKFQHNVHVLLTINDRQYLLGALREYQSHTRHIDRLVLSLLSVLDTPAKLDLLRDIRQFIPSNHLARYDRLAPYHKMAHPWHPAGVTASLGRLPKKKPVSTHGALSLPATPQLRAKYTAVAPMVSEALSDMKGDILVLTLTRSRAENLGFSVRGGSEHGLGIFTSKVQRNSAAERSGLKVGDNLLEVNGVSFDSIASSGAVKVLTGNHRLKIVLRRMGRVPAFRSAKEKVSWYDSSSGALIDGEYKDHGAFHDPSDNKDVIERRLNISSHHNIQHMGFNIRGGMEYGIGVYVSRVDSGGLAQYHGLRVGDQIIRVNGRDFSGVTHTMAVNFIKSSPQLVMTVRDIGRYPAFKEIYAEYRWLDTTLGTITKTRSSPQKKSIAVDTTSQFELPLNDGDVVSQHTLHEFPEESQFEALSMLSLSLDNLSADQIFSDIFPEVMPEERSIRDIVTDSFAEHLSLRDFSADSFAHDLNAFNQNGGDEDILHLPGEEEIKRDNNVSTQTDVADEEVLRHRHTDVMMVPQPLTSSNTLPLPPRPQNQQSQQKKTPKSTIAVRAMELETRKQYPELSKSVPDHKMHEDDSVTGSQRSRTFTEKLFGSKSRSKFRSVSHGTEGKRNRSRKPLTSINFSLRKKDKGVKSRPGLDGATGNDSLTLSIKQAASELMNEDEMAAILRHIDSYETIHDLSGLMLPLFAILDTPEKLVLLEKIRPCIIERDIHHYDQMTREQQQKLRPAFVSPNVLTVGQRTTVKTVKQKQAPPKPPRSRSRSDLRPIAKRQPASSQDIERIKSLGIPSDGDIHDIVMPNSADARHSLQFQRRQSNSRVYADVGGGLSASCGDLPEEMALYTGSISSVSTVNLSTYENGTSALHDTHSERSNPSPQYDTIPPPPPLPTGGFTNHTHQESVNASPLSEEESQQAEEEAAASLAAALNMFDALVTDEEGDVNDRLSTAGTSSSDESRQGSYDVSPSVTDTAYQTHGSLRNSMKYQRQASQSNTQPHENHISLSYSQPQQASNSHHQAPQTHIEQARSAEYQNVFVAPPPPSESPPLSVSDSSPREAQVPVHRSEPSTRSVIDVSPQVNIFTPASYSPLRRGQKDSGPSSDRQLDTIIFANETIEDDTSSPVPEMSPHAGHMRDNHFSPDIAPPMLDVSPEASSMIDKPVTPEVAASILGMFPGDRMSPAGAEDDHVHVNTTIDYDVITVVLDKSIKPLGLSISGGSNSVTQPNVLIQKVFPNGATAIEGTIKAGMQLLAVDGHSMDGVTHTEAVDIIRKSYQMKRNAFMVLKLQPQ